LKKKGQKSKVKPARREGGGAQKHESLKKLVGTKKRVEKLTKASKKRKKKRGLKKNLTRYTENKSLNRWVEKIDRKTGNAKAGVNGGEKPGGGKKTKRGSPGKKNPRSPNARDQKKNKNGEMPKAGDRNQTSPKNSRGIKVRKLTNKESGKRISENLSTEIQLKIQGRRRGGFKKTPKNSLSRGGAGGAKTPPERKKKGENGDKNEETPKNPVQKESMTRGKKEKTLNRVGQRPREGQMKNVGNNRFLKDPRRETERRRGAGNDWKREKNNKRVRGWHAQNKNGQRCANTPHKHFWGR